MTVRSKLPKRRESFVAGVGRGMRRAARTAREVARRYGRLRHDGLLEFLLNPVDSAGWLHWNIGLLYLHA